MEFEKTDLEKISGGQIIESTNGEFFILPDGAKGYKTKEAAQEAEKMFKKEHPHHMHPGMPHKHGPFGPKPEKLLPPPVIEPQITANSEAGTASIDLLNK